MVTIQNSWKAEQQARSELAALLRCYTHRAGLTYEQLAEAADLALDTLLNWVKGRVRRPRHWRDIARIAAVLHLTASEADALLQAAGYSALAVLQRAHPHEALLAEWPSPPLADSGLHLDADAQQVEIAITPLPTAEPETLAARLPQAQATERVADGGGLVRTLLRRWRSERR